MPRRWLLTLEDAFLPVQAGQVGQAGAGQLGGGGLGAQLRSFQTGGDDPTLSRVPLSFSTDLRTNSIIAAGSPNDMLAVEALILKLDSNVQRERKTEVYRLRNLAATDAELAIANFLQAQAISGLLTGDPQTQAVQNQILQEVTVIAVPTSAPPTLTAQLVATQAPVSNILLVSSTPRYFEQVMRVIEELDARPPQVVIQVLIAEVSLNDDEDFGLGIRYPKLGPVRSESSGDEYFEPGFRGAAELAHSRLQLQHDRPVSDARRSQGVGNRLAGSLELRARARERCLPDSAG